MVSAVKMGDENQNVSKDQTKDPMAILEDGLILCKFGRFHIRLLFTSMAAVFASTMVTTTSSYILPMAECDLNMSIMHKGLLNAMPFFGQVGATFFTGFLVDAFGRRIFLVGGNAAIFVCTIIEGSSQNYWMLIVLKLLEGIALSLSFTAVASMVSEFVHKNIRDRILMLYCSFMSLSLVVAALISWGVLLQPWHVVIIKGYFELRIWNIYLYICSIWSLLAAVLYCTIPESPKYLLSHGQEREALEVLRKVYSENTGKPKTEYPITSLGASSSFKSTKEMSIKKQMTHAMIDVKELFRAPLFCRLILFSSLTFVCLLAYSALRLWYPQLSTIIENYQKDYGKTDRFCVMMNDYRYKLNDKIINVSSNITDTEICIPQVSGSETYTNGIILGLFSMFFVGASGYLVDFVGQKILMFILLILCAICSGSLYWTYSSIQAALLISATCGLMQSALSLQQNILIRVFPTTVRTLALSAIVMIGRIGSLLGNILFPIMLELGCMGPFLALSVITLGVAGLVYFLPNPNKENNGAGDK
ncbi:PREDICTED: synaptic vesicle glycoprotein 2C-like [Papilio polytes]|uniref:synaptic vesicle glycoprotein 2C-like n=1 Tax=Papilio polytes TaxID=76194 RepID=UPI000676A6FF|nr:PREDICTED: synaptic vesicle glycoprotein 2C-like [Papilio polytes]